MTNVSRIVLVAVTHLLGACEPAPGPAAAGLDPPTIAIVDGIQTDELRMAGLLLRTGNPGWSCSAVLIHPRFVLTAAHCVGFSDQNPEQFRYRHIVRHNPPPAQIRNYDVVAIKNLGPSSRGGPVRPGIPPAMFRVADNFGNVDIAIVRLSSPVTDDVAPPAALAVKRPASGSAVTLVGFSQEQTQGCLSNGRQYRELALSIDNLGRLPPGLICEGDSGGPLFQGDFSSLAGYYADPNVFPGIDVDHFGVLGVNSSSFGTGTELGSTLWHREALDSAMGAMDGTPYVRGSWRDSRGFEIETTTFTPVVPTTINQCRDRCLATAPCKAFNFAEIGNEGFCTTYRAVGPWFPAPSTVVITSGVRPASATNADNELEQSVCRTGTSFSSRRIDGGPGECRFACAGNNRCRSFTFTQSLKGGGTCSLRSNTGGPSSTNPLCTSGVRRGLEYDIDRPGLDIGGDVFEDMLDSVPKGSPETCQALCAQRDDCKAFTFVNGRVSPNAKPLCFLKHAVPGPVAAPPSFGIVSGIKGHEFR